VGLRIVWSQRARDRLIEIAGYVAERDADAAARLWQRLVEVTGPLSDHPYIYRPGRVGGTRELVVHPNYIIVYRVLEDSVEIDNILHARRQYP
jgi:toxin ParE1/3/4